MCGWEIWVKMSLSLAVMTFNLHEDQPPDSPNSWEKRRDLCISVITNYSPVILCTQQGPFSSPCTPLYYMYLCMCICWGVLVIWLKWLIWVFFDLCFGGGILIFHVVVGLGEWCFGQKGSGFLLHTSYLTCHTQFEGPMNWIGF